jgi:hypothetical protein
LEQDNKTKKKQNKTKQNSKQTNIHTLSLYLVDVPHDYAMTDLMNQNKGNDVM